MQGIGEGKDARETALAEREAASGTPVILESPASARQPSLPPDLGVDLRAPQLYLNRELSWLAFNDRVLAEAENEAVPLLERVKFHAIVASNLDEFFMVRVAGLKQQLSGEVDDLPADGMTAVEALAAIYLRVQKLVARAEANLGITGTLDQLG